MVQKVRNSFKRHQSYVTATCKRASTQLSNIKLHNINASRYYNIKTNSSKAVEIFHKHLMLPSMSDYCAEN